MMRRFPVFIFFVVLPAFLSGQKISRDEYINQYKDLAMIEMLRSGVPASITLAQGMLESDNGNSRLALKANNHFGIKCHNDWRGRRIYHDDDERNECFRRYSSVYESYVDHSDFLRGKTRYAELFELEITDYKGWARGLKSAGYATHRKYANLLIQIIEENELHQYDLLALEDYDPEEDIPLLAGSKKAGDMRTILLNNRIDYIIVKPGDTFNSLNEQFRLLDYELYKYNELTPDSTLEPGQILYLQPKRNRAEAGREYHTVKPGETLYEISQLYGVKLNKLYEKNFLKAGEEIEPGTRINLRKKKKRGLFNTIVPEAVEEKEEREEFEFQFDH